MGKLLDAFRKKYQQIQEFGSLPEPDPLQNPQDIYEHAVKANDYQYIGDHVRRQLLDAVKALPREKQLEFYTRCRKDNAPKAFSEADFLKIMDNEILRDLDTGFLWEDGWFGQDVSDTIAVLEELAGPEASEKIGEAIENIVPPTDPSLSEEDKLQNTHSPGINTTRAEIAQNDPEREKKLEILSRAEKALVSPKPEVMKHVNGLDHYIQDAYSIVMNSDLNHYIDTAEGGKYKDKFVKGDSYTLKAQKYAPEIASPKNSSITEEELRNLENQDLNISEELLQEITEITDAMEEIGEAGYRETPGVFQNAPNGAAESYFSAEQGIKNYAFWPLVMKRRAIEAALTSGDYDAIDKAEKEYQRVRKITDKMMETAKKNPSTLCPGNVNSTRLTGQENEIPLEYTQDFISHSKVNGLYELFALSKNIGKPIPEILQNPVKAMRDAGKEFVRKYGLNSPKTTAKKTVLCPV